MFKRLIALCLSVIMTGSVFSNIVMAENIVNKNVELNSNIVLSAENDELLHPFAQDEDGNIFETKTHSEGVMGDNRPSGSQNTDTDFSGLTDIAPIDEEQNKVELMYTVSETVYCRRQILIHGSSSNRVKLYRSPTATTQVDEGWDCYVREVEITALGYVNYTDGRASRFFFYAKNGNTGVEHLYYVDYYINNVTEGTIYHTYGSASESHPHRRYCDCGANYTTSDSSCYTCYPSYIYYYGNGGNDVPATQTVTSSTAYISSKIPTKFGYRFDGWSTNSSASYGSYYPGGSVSLAPYSTQTFYAVWEAPMNLSTTSQTTGYTYIDVGGTVAYFKFTPSVSAVYEFVSTNSSGDTYGELYSSSGSRIVSDNNGAGNGQFKMAYYLTAGTTYYLGVRWLNSNGTGRINVRLRRQYNISYNANGGSSAPTAQTKLYGDSINLSSTCPVRDLWQFKGWATTADATTARYQPGESYDANADLTLYAVWGYPTGSCGENATWTYSPEDKSLTISGSGAMYDYSSSADVPWHAYVNNIDTINFATGITIIGKNAFSGCKNVTAITLPGSVTAIREYAFSGCAALDTITIPSSVTSIGNDAFSACSALKDVYYGGSRADWKMITIGSGNDYLLNATIHFTDPTIYNITYNYSANGGTSATKTIDNVEEGTAANLRVIATKSGWDFVGWNTDSAATTALTSHTVTGDVTLYAIFKKTLTASFYSGEKELQTTQSVIIYNTATSGDIITPVPNEFSGWKAEGWRDDSTATTKECDALATVTISANKKFYGIYSRNLTLSYNANGGSSTPQSQTSVQYYNAYGKKQNRKFTLAAAITKSGSIFDKWAMDSVGGTTYDAGSSITITDSATMYAIWNKDIVTSGTCGKNLIWELDGTNTLTISGTGEMIDWYSASSVPWYSYRGTIKKVVIETGVTSIGDYAFYECTALTDITLPEGLMRIGAYAFAYCQKLESVNYMSTSADWKKISIGSGNTPLTNAKLVCLSRGTKTSYTITSTGEKRFTIIPENLPVGSKIILACYKNKKLVQLRSATNNNESVYFTINKEFDYAQVMVWDSFTKLKPVCKADFIK